MGPMLLWAPLCTPAQGGGTGSPPPCTLAQIGGTGTPPLGTSVEGGGTGSLPPNTAARAEGQGFPLCTTTQGGGTVFPTSAHHSAGRRDKFPTPVLCRGSQSGVPLWQQPQGAVRSWQWHGVVLWQQQQGAVLWLKQQGVELKQRQQGVAPWRPQQGSMMWPQQQGAVLWQQQQGAMLRQLPLGAVPWQQRRGCCALEGGELQAVQRQCVGGCHSPPALRHCSNTGVLCADSSCKVLRHGSNTRVLCYGSHRWYRGGGYGGGGGWKGRFGGLHTRRCTHKAVYGHCKSLVIQGGGCGGWPPRWAKGAICRAQRAKAKV